VATPPEPVEQVLALALKHPLYGCNKLEALLMGEGKRLANVTIQKILQDHQMGTRYES
jgi:hypothetical protein